MENNEKLSGMPEKIFLESAIPGGTENSREHVEKLLSTSAFNGYQKVQYLKFITE